LISSTSQAASFFICQPSAIPTTSAVLDFRRIEPLDFRQSTRKAEKMGTLEELKCAESSDDGRGLNFVNSDPALLAEKMGA
jgi:hypothetical protein